MSGMNAEEDLIDSLMHPPYIGDSKYGCDEAEARMLVRAYAHELAEKQREELKRNPGIFEDALIDLIDSEREDGDD